jgi:hypothetical protein
LNLHRVRRLWGVLLISQFRSGRSTSDPSSFFGRTYAMIVLDVALFLGAAGIAEAIVRTLPEDPATFAAVFAAAAPFVPFLAVGVVAIAGVLFELTATARFSGSDAANWLPITPSEYTVASASAIATSYSPVAVLLLGGLLPIAFAGNDGTTYLLAFLLGGLGLLEGGLLVEIVRSISQRSGRASSGRVGSVAIVVRAALIVAIIVVFDLAFNPVFLLGFLNVLTGNPIVAGAVPILWPTEALIDSASGGLLTGLAFAVADLGFVVLLAGAAGALRKRYWVPTGGEIELGSSPNRPGHPLLAAVGLAPAEAAIVSKDLRGLVRRRDMVPVLALPAVLVLLLLIEGSATGAYGETIWSGWVVGFFALLLATRSVGQERRAFALLFAFPIRAATIFRAKAASVLLPALLVGAGLTVAATLLGGLGPADLVELLVLNGFIAALLTLWGLGFAARYSDFQERPRPQFLRPGPMLAAIGSGSVLLLSIYVPAAVAILGGAPGFGAPLIVGAAVVAALAGLGSYWWARRGFDALALDLSV